MSSWFAVDPWKPIDVPASKLPHTPDKLRAVLRDLAVEKSQRYKAREGQTWCNIFLWDVCRAMGCEIPHWVDKDGNRADVGKGRELSANGMVRWLDEHGARHGWVDADRETAMDAAARGHVVVLGWDSKSAKSGHVAVMLPEGTIAQAGRRNFVGETISQGFGALPVRFWIQAKGPHSALTEKPKQGRVRA